MRGGQLCSPDLKMKRSQLCSQDLEMKRDIFWQPSGRDGGEKVEKTGLNFLLREKKAARPGQKLKILIMVQRTFFLLLACTQNLNSCI